MNILILALAFAPYSGVGAARMTSLAAYLVKKKVNVTVITYDSQIYAEVERQRQIPERIELHCYNRIDDKRKNVRQLRDFVFSCIKKKHFDLCISSVGPYESMFFIKYIWKKYHVPYIIDYRDPWLYERSTEKLHGKRRWKQAVYNFLCTPIEKAVVKYAARLVLVTENCKKDLVKRYHIKGEKCAVIFNGYEEIPQTYEEAPNDKFTIAVAGKFSYYNSKAAEAFLAACKRCCKTVKMQLVHIGAEDKEMKERYPDVYVNAGIKNYEETMRKLGCADVLLISYAHTVGLGTKVFDYIAWNKPIIYMGTVPAELADFVAGFEKGYVCRNEEEAYHTLLKIYQEQVTYLTDKDVSYYSREMQNRRYYELLCDLCR